MTTAAKVEYTEDRRPAAAPVARVNRVGTVSLLAAVAGAAGCRLALGTELLGDATWVRVAAAGCEAAMVGGLADWFAVTALFRHPLGIPIPHTAIIRTRRAKIIESIVSMVQDEWLSPEVIGARLARMAPSELVIEWLQDPARVERVGAPVRDVLTAVARMLNEPEVVEFFERVLQRQLRELPINSTAGDWLVRVAESQSAAAAFETVAGSLVNLVRRPGTAENVQIWLDRTARQLHRDGKRLVPLILRRKIVQRKIVEAACDYAAAELAGAMSDPQHPLRTFVFNAVRRFAQRLARGDAQALEQVEQFRNALVESLEAGPLVGEALTQLRNQLSADLEQPGSYLSELVDRKLRAGVIDLLQAAGRRAAFDHWVRTTAQDLLRRHHHQVGLTVRESLEALDTDTLVTRIEDRVGADLQFIRLNGAVVGGLIGVLLALAHMLVG